MPQYFSLGRMARQKGRKYVPGAAKKGKDKENKKKATRSTAGLRPAPPTVDAVITAPEA